MTSIMADTSSIITINKKALENNMLFLKRKIGRQVRLSSIIKSNAYGHGYKEMMPLLCELGIDHFSVFNYYEAISASKYLTCDSDILIMGYIPENRIKDCIIKGFELNCFSLDRLISISEIAVKLDIPARIHLEVETGMNRSGLSYEELLKACAILQENRSLL